MRHAPAVLANAALSGPDVLRAATWLNQQLTTQKSSSAEKIAISTQRGP